MTEAQQPGYLEYFQEVTREMEPEKAEAFRAGIFNSTAAELYQKAAEYEYYSEHPDIAINVARERKAVPEEEIWFAPEHWKRHAQMLRDFAQRKSVEEAKGRWQDDGGRNWNASLNYDGEYVEVFSADLVDAL